MRDANSDTVVAVPDKRVWATPRVIESEWVSQVTATKSNYPLDGPISLPTS